MRNWCLRHPVGFMALYLVFYLCFFFALEAIHDEPRFWIHCSLDDVIPFCKYFIVPYALWAPWVAGTLLYMVRRAPRAEFWRLCLPLFAGMLLALSFCAVLPNGVALRPRAVAGDDLFARAVRLLYRADTSTNVCPSIHVFNSVTVTMAYQRSSCFAGQRRRWIRAAAQLFNLAVILSTMLLKQHSVIDVVCGLVLALMLDGAASALEQGRVGRARLLRRW